MNAIFALLGKSVLGFLGKKLAPLLFSWVIAAVNEAETANIAVPGNLTGKELKQYMRNAKREIAVDRVKSHLPDAMESLVPDKVINFFIEFVLLAQQFGFLDQLQKAIASA